MPRNSVQRCRARRLQRSAAASELRFMKVGVGALMLGMAAMLVVAACTDHDRRNARGNQIVDQVDDLARETVYFRDLSGVCWGIVWVGGGHGGPAGGPFPNVGPSDPCPPAPPAERPALQEAP